MALAVEAADRLRDGLEPLAGNRLAAVAAGPIGAVGEGSPGVVYPALLRVEDETLRLLELLLVQIARAVGRVLVDVGELGAAQSVAGADHRGPRANQLGKPSIQRGLDPLSLLSAQGPPSRRVYRVPGACPRSRSSRTARPTSRRSSSSDTGSRWFPSTSCSAATARSARPRSRTIRPSSRSFGRRTPCRPPRSRRSATSRASTTRCSRRARRSS